MQHLSAADVTARSEGVDQPSASPLATPRPGPGPRRCPLRGQDARGPAPKTRLRRPPPPCSAPAPCPAADRTRLSRRQFLYRSTLTVAGVGALSGLEWLQSTQALAQGVQPGTGFFLLEPGRVGSARDASGTLVEVQHAYRYDYRFGSGNTPAIPTITTFRQGQPLTTRIQRLSTATLPYPSAPPPDQPQLLICNRFTQLANSATISVFDWCTFYARAGDQIIISAIGEPLSYIVPFIQPITNGIGIPNGWPDVNSGGWLAETSSDADYRFHWLTYSSQRVVSSTAVWTTELQGFSNDRMLKLEVYIPTSSQPARRTANAVYRFNHLRRTETATIDQGRWAGQWVTLGDPGGYPFRTGVFQVSLTDMTGEPDFAREIVAIGILYLDP